VLENYTKFGVGARAAAASVFLDFFKRAADANARKFAALKVVEEWILATEDLAMVYFALRDRRQRPVLEGLLHTKINANLSQQWARELDASDDQVLETLGLVEAGELLGDWPSPAEWLQALRGSVDIMRNAAANRTVKGGVLVKGFNKLKHGFIAVSLPNWIEAPAKPDEAVAIIYTERQLGQINRAVVEATDAKVQEIVDSIQDMTNAARWLIASHLKAEAARG